MATVADIKKMKREDLDKLAVEQGIDPAEFSKVDDLRAEMLKTADDAEDAGDAGNAGDQGSDNGDAGDENGADGNTTTESAQKAVNEAEKAADAAEKSAKKTVERQPGHASSFDANGQPKF